MSFSIEVEVLGPFFLASASVPKEGLFVRVRPFSALGRSGEAAIEMLKDQIRLEFRRVPETAPAD